MPALKTLERHADTLQEPDRLAIYEDVAVFRQEWDQYLRASDGSKSLNSFMSSKALGNTQKAVREGVALLTVHSSKGLEFDVVFIVGMAEGTFPDYRAASQKELGEESRNAFVAVTRSKRLLYLTYPATRVMPWGEFAVRCDPGFCQARKVGPQIMSTMTVMASRGAQLLPSEN